MREFQLVQNPALTTVIDFAPPLPVPPAPIRLLRRVTCASLNFWARDDTDAYIGGFHSYLQVWHLRDRDHLHPESPTVPRAFPQRYDFAENPEGIYSRARSQKDLRF